MNNDGKVSEQELNDAIAILQKSKKEKQKLAQKKSFTEFHEYKNN